MHAHIDLCEQINAFRVFEVKNRIHVFQCSFELQVWKKNLIPRKFQTNNRHLN